MRKALISCLLTVGALLCGTPAWHALISVTAGQPAQTAATPRADIDRLMADVRTLSDRGLEGRQTGSEGSGRARAFILRRFRELKLQPVAGTHEQKFPFTPRSKGAGVPPANTSALHGTNVMGMIGGSAEPDRFVLLGAHFDHLGRRDDDIYPGADDNASGVAGMLAAASWFAQHPLERSVVFIAFDAEEHGLQGARHFVKNPPVDLTKIVAIVNLDMIGRGDENTLWAAGTHHYPALKPPVVEAARSRTIKVMFGHDRPKAEAGAMADWTNSSDHGPFHAVGVPFLYFGVEDHPDYHKPTDTADRIPRAFFAEAVTLVIDVIERLASSRFFLPSSF